MSQTGVLPPTHVFQANTHASKRSNASGGVPTACMHYAPWGHPSTLPLKSAATTQDTPIAAYWNPGRCRIGTLPMSEPGSALWNTPLPSLSSSTGSTSRTVQCHLSASASCTGAQTSPSHPRSLLHCPLLSFPPEVLIALPPPHLWGTGLTARERWSKK